MVEEQTLSGNVLLRLFILPVFNNVHNKFLKQLQLMHYQAISLRWMLFGNVAKNRVETERELLVDGDFCNIDQFAALYRRYSLSFLVSCESSAHLRRGRFCMTSISRLHRAVVN